MSFKTWKKEFYPVSAANRKATKTELAAAEHSLRKWRGLLKVNLEKHGVWIESGDVVEHGGVVLPVDCDTCALCRRHTPADAGWGDARCNDCVLTELLNGRTCAERDESPFKVFLRYANPRPMICLLEKAVKHLKAKQ